MPRQITIIESVIMHPASAFNEISKNPKKFLAVSISLLALIAVIEISDVYIFESYNFGLAMLIVFQVILAPILIYNIANMKGEKPSFSDFISVFGYIAVPWLFYVLIKHFLIFLGFDFLELSNPDGISDTTLSIAIGIWAMVLGAYAVEQTHKIKKFHAFLIIILTLFLTTLIGYYFIIGWIFNPL